MPPLTIAVLSNPGSGRNRRHGLQAVDALCGRHGLAHYRVGNPEAVASALRALLPAMPDVLAINSGDGTVNLVVAALRALALEREPMLALLRGGSTNMIHRDAGLRGSPAAALRRLLRRCRAGTVQAVARAPLYIAAAGAAVADTAVADTAAAPRYGFFLATGAIPRVTAAVRQGLHRRGMFGRGSELLALLGSLWKLWRRRVLPHGDPLAPQDFAWAADGVARHDRLVFFAATSLRRLLFGIRTRAGAARIGIVTLNAGRRIGHADAVTLAFTAAAEWVIDGEPQPPGSWQVRLDRPLRMISNA